MKLQGKIAIVTGAAQGIGKGVALEYEKTAQTSRCWTSMRRSLPKQQRKSKRWAVSAHLRAGDVSDEAVVKAFVEKRNRGIWENRCADPLRRHSSFLRDH